MSSARSRNTAVEMQRDRSWFRYWELLIAIPCDAAGLLTLYLVLMLFLSPAWSRQQSGVSRAAQLYLALPACAGLCCFGISTWLRRHATQRGFKRTRGSKIASMLCVVLLVVLLFFLIAIFLPG